MRAVCAAKRVNRLQVTISNMREEAGVSPLQPWFPAREIRDQLAAAEQAKLDLYGKISRLITTHDRAATGPSASDMKIGSGSVYERPF